MNKQKLLLLMSIIGAPSVWLSIYVAAFNVFHEVYDVVDKSPGDGIEMAAGVLASGVLALCIIVILNVPTEKKP